MESESQVDLTKLTTEQAYQFMWNALNKACKQGVFTIDESYVIKVSSNHIKSVLEKMKDETMQ
jgi:hypothetical protein